ncbi:helix-turn-helix domain-containing protein [Streptomyces sp. NPDC002917]|uniref:helix-turn-helix domain-containing protein n=1 Tax=Streptomyces sp. NPDC002917 TaxID=3364671 RepID=UPI003697BAFD
MHFNITPLLVAAARQRVFGTADLARHLGIPYATVYRWIRGDGAPSAKALARIHTRYGLTTTDLFTQDPAA